MIVGGIVFRVVTHNYPGCPALDRAGAPEIRTEYLAGENPDSWTLKRDEALWFSRHLDAEVKAHEIGPRCHASVARPSDEEKLPERLQNAVPDPVPGIKIPPLDKRRLAELHKEGAVNA